MFRLVCAQELSVPIFLFYHVSKKQTSVNIILACAWLHESGITQGKHCSVNQVYGQVILLLLLKLFLSLHGTWRYTKRRLRSCSLPDYKLKLSSLLSFCLYLFHSIFSMLGPCYKLKIGEFCNRTRKKGWSSTAAWLFGCLPVHMLPLPVDLALACTSNTDQKIERWHEMYQMVWLQGI